MDILRQLSENWFLQEPAFFALLCQQQLEENVRMECAVRCGQGRVEYNPLVLRHKNYAEVEQLMRIEMIRLFLKHPYEREPEGCSREAMAIGSDITIADGYCLLHKEKLPLRDPGYYHLPLGQYYEWYAKAVQQQSQEQGQKQPQQGQSKEQQQQQGAPVPDGSPSGSPDSPQSDRDKSQLWREDSLQRQRINELIERTTDWGTLPGELVERIKASTQAHINQRLIWQGFHSAILSSQRHLTRMRPNRRTGFLQMGSTRQFDTHLLVAIDVSGSITDAMLADFFSSVNRLFRYGVVQIDLVQFDAELGSIQPLTNAHKDITIKGRGGTDYQPLFDEIDRREKDYDGLLILTDGQAPPPRLSKRLHDGHFPVLWVCPNREAYEQSREWMQKVGRVCHL